MSNVRLTILSLALIIFFLVQLSFGFAIFTDDPFISFRYARNLSQNKGFVFNSGEKVEGYTNFLWVILLSIGINLGVDPIIFSKVLGLLLNGLTLVLIGLYSARYFKHWFLFLSPILLLIASEDFIRWGGGGLETPLFIFCVTASFAWLFLKSKPGVILSVIFASAAALTRPEGLWFAPAMGIFSWLELRKTTETSLPKFTPLYFFAFWSVLVLPYHFWRTFYFGDIFPNTFYCKVCPGLKTSFSGAMYLLDFIRHNGGVILVLGIGAAMTRVRREFLYPVIFTGIYSAGVITTGGDWMPFHRFAVPVLPLLLLVFVSGVQDIHGKFKNKRLVQICILLIPLIFIFNQPDEQVTLSLKRFKHRIQGKSVRTPVMKNAVMQNTSSDEEWLFNHRKFAEWLKHNMHSDTLLAIGSAGVIPYFSELPTIDFFGRVTPEIAHSSSSSPWKLPGHKKYNREIILDAEPDIIIFSGRGDTAKEPRFWLRQFKLDSCEKFKEKYTFHTIDIDGSSFSYYQLNDTRISQDNLKQPSVTGSMP